MIVTPTVDFHQIIQFKLHKIFIFYHFHAKQSNLSTTKSKQSNLS